MSRILGLSRLSAVALVAAAGLALTGGGGTASATSATTFSGQATVLKGSVLGLPISLVDTGPIGASGGQLEANLLCYPNGPNCILGVPDLTNHAVAAEVLHAAVVSHGNHSHAEASVANLALNGVAGNDIGVELLRADADATCNGGSASVSGGAEVANLVINGKTISVTGAPNQTIVLPSGGVVVINEQTGSASGGQGGITVNALHISIPGVLGLPGTDLIVAQAHADVVCGATPGGCTTDKMTGGGSIAKDVNFAFAAKELSSWGHLLFMDKRRDVKVKGDPQSAVLSGSKAGGMADAEGPASGTSNGTSVGWFVVHAEDNAEPGKGADTFTIALFDVKNGNKLYDSTVDIGSGVLTGGNLQYHACK